MKFDDLYLKKIGFSIGNRLGGEVSKVFPELLLTTMEILYTQYKTLKGRDNYSFSTDTGREKVYYYSFKNNCFSYVI